MSELAVRCEALRKRYGDVVAVDELTVHVRRGECFATIEILEGLLTPDADEVEVLGLHWAQHERELRQRLASSWHADLSRSGYCWPCACTVARR